MHTNNTGFTIHSYLSRFEVLVWMGVVVDEGKVIFISNSTAVDV